MNYHVVKKLSIIGVVSDVDSLQNFLNLFNMDTLKDEVEIFVIGTSKSNIFMLRLKKLYKKYGHRFVLNDGLSMGEAYNFAIKHASGEYIYFYNGRDCLERDFFSNMLRRTYATKADIVFCDYSVQGKDGNSEVLNKRLIPKITSFSADDIPEIILNIIPNYIGCQVYRRDFILKSELNFETRAIFPDTSFSLKALSLAKKISFEREKLVSRDNMKILGEQNYYETIDSLCEVHRFLIERGLLEKLEISFLNQVMNMLYSEKDSFKEPFSSFWRQMIVSEILKNFDYESKRKNIFRNDIITKWFFDLSTERKSNYFYDFFFNQREKIIPIVLPASYKDDIPRLSPIIASIKEHVSKEYFYDIYIFSRQYTINQKNILESETGLNFRVSIVDISKGFPLNIDEHYTRDSSFYVTLIPLFLYGYDKVLFIKDGVVLQDIVLLMQNSLKNAYIAGTLDRNVEISYVEEKLGIICETYVNTDILFINIKEWVENDLTSRFIECLNTQKNLKYPIKDTLNIVCRDKTLVVDPMWNYPYRSLLENPDMERYCTIDGIGILNYQNEQIYFNPEKQFASIWWNYARKTNFYELLFSKCVLYTLEKNQQNRIKISVTTKEKQKNSQEQLYLLKSSYIKEAILFLLTFGEAAIKHRKKLKEIEKSFTQNH